MTIPGVHVPPDVFSAGGGTTQKLDHTEVGPDNRCPIAAFVASLDDPSGLGRQRLRVEEAPGRCFDWLFRGATDANLPQDCQPARVRGVGGSVTPRA